MLNRVKENIYFQMVMFMKEIGSMMKKKEMVFINSKTVINMKVNLKKVKNKVTLKRRSHSESSPEAFPRCGKHFELGFVTARFLCE